MTISTKITTLVSVIDSSSGSPTLYPYERKFEDKNCIVYKVISSVPQRTMNNGNIFEKTRIQLTCWGDTLHKSRDLAEDMKTLLEDDVTNFTISFLVSDFTIKDTETELYQTYLDFMIW